MVGGGRWWWVVVGGDGWWWGLVDGGWYCWKQRVGYALTLGVRGGECPFIPPSGSSEGGCPFLVEVIEDTKDFIQFHGLI